MNSSTGAAIASLVLLGACAGDGGGLDENGRPTLNASGALTPQLQSIQIHVFTPVCATCHSGAAAPLGLRLDAGASYATLVNAPSAEASGRTRVVPGNPDASYLIQKLEGRAEVGGRMPLNSPALPAETIAVIRQWIIDGAAVSSDGPATTLAKIEAAWPPADASLRESPRRIVISSDVELDTSLLSAGTMTLRGSGGDGAFTDGNEREIDAAIEVRSLQPTVVAFTAPADAWLADQYELRISGSAPLAVTDRNAQAIDGDGDGIAGGDYVLRFTVESGK